MSEQSSRRRILGAFLIGIFTALAILAPGTRYSDMHIVFTLLAVFFAVVYGGHLYPGRPTSGGGKTTPSPHDSSVASQKDASA